MNRLGHVKQYLRAERICFQVLWLPLPCIRILSCIFAFSLGGWQLSNMKQKARQNISRVLGRLTSAHCSLSSTVLSITLAITQNHNIYIGQLAQKFVGEFSLNPLKWTAKEGKLGTEQFTKNLSNFHLMLCCFQMRLIDQFTLKDYNSPIALPLHWQL